MNKAMQLPDLAAPYGQGPTAADEVSREWPSSKKGHTPVSCVVPPVARAPTAGPSRQIFGEAAWTVPISACGSPDGMSRQALALNAGLFSGTIPSRHRRDRSTSHVVFWAAPHARAVPAARASVEYAQTVKAATMKRPATVPRTPHLPRFPK